MPFGLELLGMGRDAEGGEEKSNSFVCLSLRRGVEGLFFIANVDSERLKSEMIIVQTMSSRVEDVRKR